MYTTYCQNQRSVDLEDRTSYRLSVTGGDFHPTWLIRVSDWQKVPGKEAIDGYHTISYCWEQSGEVVKNESQGDKNEYSIVDNGKHCIIEEYNVYEDHIMGAADFFDAREDDDQETSYEETDEEDDIHVDFDTGQQELSSNNYNGYVTWCESKSKATAIRYVTYSQLLRQICKDFQVEYVWYDKICIGQSDSKAK